MDDKIHIHQSFQQFTQCSDLDATSPLPSQGNLTGIPRKLKDSCADWHNLIQRWENLTVAGKDVIRKIVRYKLQSPEGVLASREDGFEMIPDTEGNAVEQTAALEGYCEQLGNVYEQLHQLMEKMEKLTETFKGILKLQEFQLQTGERKSRLLPVFKTWTPELFYVTSKNLMSMFRKEFEVKRCILENVAHTMDTSLLTFMIVMWTHQPYIKREANIITESMLTETGHR